MTVRELLTHNDIKIADIAAVTRKHRSYVSRVIARHPRFEHATSAPTVRAAITLALYHAKLWGTTTDLRAGKEAP